MTLKIGLDVQFIKTETAGGDFRETSCNCLFRRKAGCNLRELKEGRDSATPFLKSRQKKSGSDHNDRRNPEKSELKKKKNPYSL